MSQVLANPVSSKATDVDTLGQIQGLYDTGKLMQAYQLGQVWGPPQDWPGFNGKILAGRILHNLGSPRLGRLLHLRALREAPKEPLALYYAGYAILERRGPLAAIQHWETNAPKVTADSGTYADWLAMRGSLAVMYRDFETADQYISAAEAQGGNNDWVRLERIRLLEAQDQFETAVASAKQLLQDRPWYRPAVHHLAHLLQVMDRDREALALLEEASAHLESVILHHQLSALQDHLHLHEQALASLERADHFCPIPEQKFLEGVAWLKSNVEYHAGHFPAAAEHARQSKHPFMLKVAEQIENYSGDGVTHPRVLLEFPFVRQHYMTCAPATLAAIGRFWNKPTDHLTVVDAICYDGTSSHSQRQWAQDNGWATREFALTWDAAVALIDRGMPFTLATRQLNTGHLQAIVGYDKMRGTLLCRDPYQYYISEFNTQILLENQAANGPRAMVMVPLDRADLLEGLSLPDAAQYDLLFSIELSLARHDRTAAIEGVHQLETTYPEHRLTYHAQWALAAYDGDRPGSLVAVESLLKSYPDDTSLMHVRALLLRSMDRSDLLIPMLGELCGKHTVDASFLHLYAEQVRAAQGDHAASERLLKRALRRQPTHAQCLTAMADELWHRRELEKAISLYQMAASLQSLNEASIQTYFNASRHLNRVEATVGLMKKRFDRLIARSSQPACTYFWALESLDRTTEAFDVLEEAQRRRPTDGELMLYTADACGRHGQFERSRQLLENARGKTHRSQWLRCSARLSRYEGNLLESLETWKQVLDAEPLAQDANREVANLIANTQSPDAAAQHLSEILERFPFNTDLAQLRIMWLRSRGKSAVAEAAAALVGRQPSNVWARVELSLALADLGKLDEALQHAEAALELSPLAVSALFARAYANERMLKVDQAREAHRQAVRISVDYSPSVEALLDLLPTVEQKREELRFIADELRQQVIFGQAITTYRKVAATVLEPGELLENLQEARKNRPDLWEGWSTVIYQLSGMGRLEEAASLASEAADRFPLLPRTWYDKSHVAGLQGDRPTKISALKQCLALSPGWSAAARQLAETYRLEGNAAEALAVLQRAIPRDPLEARNYQAYAHLLWDDGKKQQAIDQMKRAVTLEPGIDHAWESLQEWMAGDGRAAELDGFVREICRQRAGEADSWTILARVLQGEQTMDERLAAVESAITLSPMEAGAHDLKAMLLAQRKSFDAAIQACDPPQFQGRPPVGLLGRRAWIYAQQKDLPKAIAAMREILETNKSYYWGWYQMLGWIADRRQPEEYLAAAQGMVRQFPNDNVARNYFAAAQLLNKDAKTAKQTLVSAVQVAPDNAFALNRLFDAQMKDKEFGPAGQTLQLIERHMRRSQFLYRKAMLAAALKEGDQATAAMTELCHRDHFDADSLNKAVTAMDQARLQKSVNEVLKATVTGKSDVPPGLVGFWAKRAASSKQWSACRQIMSLYPQTTPQWLEAALAYVDGLTKEKQFFTVNRFIRQQRKRTDLPTRLWGYFGYALFSQAKPARTIRALRDWQDRTDAEPWMLLNLADAYRRTNRFDLANAVQQAAVKLNEDQTTAKHRVWLAIDEAAAGTPGENVKRVTSADHKAMDQHYAVLVNLVRALAPLCENNPDATKARTARREVALAVRKAPTWKKRRELRLAARACVARIVAIQPTLSNRCWQLMWRIRGA
jgi:tetratricopeptide (TPR) repeat protein